MRQNTHDGLQKRRKGFENLVQSSYFDLLTVLLFEENGWVGNKKDDEIILFRTIECLLIANMTGSKSIVETNREWETDRRFTECHEDTSNGSMTSSFCY